MIAIAETNHYSIIVDKEKNRVYLTIKGIWVDPSDVPNFMDDIRKTTLETQNGFTVFADLTRLKIPSKKMRAIHTEAEKVFIDAGLSKTAEILPKNYVTNAEVEEYAKASMMQRKGFKDKKEAKVWLDAET